VSIVPHESTQQTEVTAPVLIRLTELDRTNYPELRDRVLASEAEPSTVLCRSYPGFPRMPLDRVHVRSWPSLDRALTRRTCVRRLEEKLPSRRKLSRLLQFAHAAREPGGRGPVPSAGGLQCLELYLVNFDEDWLPGGCYHYDRLNHSLAQLKVAADREKWLERMPSLGHVEGGSLLWILVGDGARIQVKYAERGTRFMLIEAGHLMQNLCLLSASLGLCTVPLGGYFEREIARELHLPADDFVLYAGVCGQV
jgi:SagB-type dehydrogenase family enzyme